MKTRLTVILASVIVLALSANVFADGWAEENAPPARPGIGALDENAPPEGRAAIRARQGRMLQQEQGTAQGVQRQPARARARIQRQLRSQINGPVQIEIVRKRITIPPVRQPARVQQPRQFRPAAQIFNRWFKALKQAYRENDKERVGNLIRRMEQLKNNARQQPGQATPGGLPDQQRGGGQMQRRQRLQGDVGQPGPEGQGPVRQRQQGLFGPDRVPAGEVPTDRAAQRPIRQLRERNRRGQIPEQENAEQNLNAEEFDWDF